MFIGIRVIFCGERMYEFLDRFIIFVLFWVCDFGGIKVIGFDGRGNYLLGVIE